MIQCNSKRGSTMWRIKWPAISVRPWHLDLSYAAFDQIAIRHRGVVDLKVRPASCGKQGTVGSGRYCSVIVTGAKAEAWCLLIHADASLSLSGTYCSVIVTHFGPSFPASRRRGEQYLPDPRTRSPTTSRGANAAMELEFKKPSERQTNRREENITVHIVELKAPREVTDAHVL